MAGVRRDGWTQSDPGAKGRAPASRGRQPGGPGSSKARAGAPFEPRRSCPELWFQFHDVTVQTCGLQAPAAAARPLARQARAPRSPRTPARPAPHPASLRGPAGAPTLRGLEPRSRPQAPRRTYSARPGRRRRRPQPCCARERAREGRAAGEGGSRPSPCRAAPRRAAGARGRLGSLTRAALRPPGPPAPPPASSARRASLPPPRAPRARDSGASPQPLASEEPRLCGSAPGSPARPPDRLPPAGSYI